MISEQNYKDYRNAISTVVNSLFSAKTEEVRPSPLQLRVRQHQNHLAQIARMRADGLEFEIDSVGFIKN